MSQPPDRKGSISIAFVREAVASLRRKGVSAAPVLEAAGIPPRLLRVDEARVGPEAFGALWLAVARTLDDEFFGLDSRRMKVGSYALLCRMAVRCGDLRGAMSEVARFLNVLLDDTRISFTPAGERVSLALVSKNRSGARNIAAQVFAHETLFVLVHGLLCWLVGRRIPVLRARFGYPRPDWWQEYQLVFCEELAFDADRTSVLFGGEALHLPVSHSEKSTREFLRGAPANFLLKYRGERGLAERIGLRLRASAPVAWPSFREIAGELGMSVSTLHRKLESEGTSFRNVKDGLRRDLAIGYLLKSDAGVVEIAAALGFAEHSAFHRAFRKWTGTSPGSYRVRHRT